MIKRLLSLLALLVLFIMPLLGVRAHAATKPDVTISPFLREVRFSADDAIKDFEVSLTNNSHITQNFKLSVLDFGSLNDSGGVVFAGTNASKLLKKYGLANWLQLSQSSITIEPGKTENVIATIINDVSLQPGGHYAAIVAALENPDQLNVNEISINQKLSSLILATKVGGEKYDLALQKIIVRSSLFRLPKTITLQFKNPGNVHVVPRGTVKILSPNKTVLSGGVINEDSGFILPETMRQILVELHGRGISNFWPTSYQIEVDYRYEGLDQFATKFQTLYFVNIAGIILIILILSGTTWLSWKFRARISKIYKIYKKKLAKSRLFKRL